MKKLFAAILILCAAAAPAQACGWYAIFTCARTPGVEGPGYTIWTSNYPNFEPGYYCNVIGPSSRSEALRNATRWGGYAKSSC